MGLAQEAVMIGEFAVRSIVRVRAVFGLMLFLLAAPAAAQPPQLVEMPSAPPVERLVDRALSRAPSVEAKRARLDAVEVAATAADALPDPMVEFEYRAGNFPRYTIGSDPNSMLGASVRQGLLNKGRREARRAVAKAGIAQGRAELDTLTTTLATAVRVLYARLFVADREQETLADAGQLLGLLEATALARYASGASDQASVLRVQLERTRLGERLADVANERFAATAALNRLTDDPPETLIGRVRELQVTTPPSAQSSAQLSAQPGESLLLAAVQQAPEIALRHAEIEVASRQVAEAREELRPSWSVGSGLYWQGGLDRMATFNVGIELPFWKARKQLPLIAAAERELRAALVELANTSAEVRAEAARLAVEWQTADAQIERYRSAILPQNTAALDATRSGYLAGRGDFVSVLDEFRRWIDVRVGLARREADRYAARARIDGLLAPVTQTPFSK
jgi:outer membrane protein TolC